MSRTALEHLLKNLCALTNEQEWLEFKENNAAPDMIGETISALANGARLRGEPCGYLVWGVRDTDHAIVGTTFQPATARKGNEELEHWLVRMLTPRLDLRYHTINVDGQRIVVLEIPAALHMPVQFSGREYVRVGSLCKPLKNYPEKERELWQLLNVSRFEQGVAKAGVESDAILQLLDYPKYFELTGQPLPAGKDGILERLVADGLVLHGRQGWGISNLGAILFARSLNDFGSLGRKGLRVIQYAGNNRIQTLREVPESKGYAVGFEGAISYINALLPVSEEI